MDSKHQFKKKYKYTTELVNQTKQTPNKNIVLVHKLHSVLTSFKCKKIFIQTVFHYRHLLGNS